MPDADTEPDVPTPCEADMSYQAGYDDADDARQWVRAAMSVLVASVPTDDMCRDQLAAVRDMRIACCERISRVMRLDVEPIE